MSVKDPVRPPGIRLADSSHWLPPEFAMASRSRSRRNASRSKSVRYAVIGLGHIAQGAMLPRSNTRVATASWSRSCPMTARNSRAWGAVTV